MAELSPLDRDFIVRTIIGEAAGEGPEGQAGVAHVIRNRLNAGGYGDSPAEIVLAPRQFTPWETRTGELLGYKKESPQYQAVGGIVDQVFGGQLPDITGGATHFANVEASDPVNQRGWIADMQRKGAVQIGRHTFGSPDSSPGRTANAGDGFNPDEFSAFKAKAAPAAESSGFSPDEFSAFKTAQKKPAPAAPAKPPVDYASNEAETQRLEKPMIAESDRALVGDASPLTTAASSALNAGLLSAPRNVQAGLDYVRGKLGTGPEYGSFSEAYERAKAVDEARSRQNPASSAVGTVGGIVGGAAVLPALRAAQGAGLAGRAITNAATGGLYGLAGGALEGHDLRSAAIGGGLGAVGGAALTPVAEKVGGLVANLFQRPASALRPDGTLTDRGIQAVRDAGLEPEQVGPVLQEVFREKGASPAAARQALGKRFGVDLSEGQATQDFGQQQFENIASRGGYGDDVRAKAEPFFENQRAQIGEAKASIGDELAGGRRVAESPVDAGAQVAEAVKAKSAEAKADYRAAYDDAFSRQGKFEPGALDATGSRITQDLESRGKDAVFVDQKTTPQGAAAIETLNNLKNLKLGGVSPIPAERVPIPEPQPPAKMDAKGYQAWGQAHDAWAAGPKETVVPAKSGALDLAGVDQARRRLVQNYAAAKASGNDADIRAVGAIRDAFDDHVENAMASGLFSGDDKALEALRKARGLVTNYRRTFTPQGPGDDAGRLMQQIIKRDAQPQEVANALFGVSKVGGKGASVRLANRLRGALGDQSPEWSAIRQGLWQRLTAKPEGVDDLGSQAIGNRIGEFLNGDGKALAGVLFSPEERATMAGFASLMKAVTPKKGAAPNSDTAPAIGSMLTKLSRQSHRIGAMLGIGVDGGMTGAVVGYGLGKALDAAGKRLSSGRNVSRIERAAAGAPTAYEPAPLQVDVIGRRVAPAAGLYGNRRAADR